jgi:hypothetical protein
MAVDHPRERDERNPSRIVGTARLHLPLHIQGQLLSQEQILRGELRMGSCRCRRQSTPSWSRRTARPSKAAVIMTSCCSSTTPEHAPARPRRSPSAISTFDPMGLDQCGSSARGQDAICPLWPATMTSLRALTHGRSPDEPVFRNRRRMRIPPIVISPSTHGEHPSRALSSKTTVTRYVTDAALACPSIAKKSHQFARHPALFRIPEYAERCGRPFVLSRKLRLKSEMGLANRSA